MSVSEILVARFGLLMTYADMAALFGLGGTEAANAMRQRMRRDKTLGNQMRSCTVCLGRRTYFRTDLVAQALDKSTGTKPALAATADTPERSAGVGDAGARIQPPTAAGSD